MRARPLLAAVLGLLVVSTPDVQAQMFSYGGDRVRATQSFAFAYQLVDFNFDGEAGDDQTFEFEGPAYGVLYTRPNVSASIAFGPESGDSPREQRLLDAVIMTWGEFILAGSPPASRLFVPIALQTNYRRVAPRGSEDSIIDSFNLTVLGLGAGLGYAGSFGDKIRFEARALPVIGLALRAFGDSAGSSYLLDADARVHLLELFGRLGLSFGYGYRTQVWNVDGSELLLDSREHRLDYSGGQHMFTMGINW